MNIIVTGAAGYVASSLVPTLREFADVIGVDRRVSEFTSLHWDLNSEGILSEAFCRNSEKETAYAVVHLAAARFDFGAGAEDYYRDNVKATKRLLEQLEQMRVSQFVHMSSVAALDGRTIIYNSSLDCDSAYRCTKFLQERLIIDWCERNEVKLHVLYPSAIFSDVERTDTNIGKLQRLVRVLPVLPRIDVAKSITSLSSLCAFIIGALQGRIDSGKYLTIEMPVLTVTEMLEELGRGRVRFVRVPFLRTFLKTVASFLWAVGLNGRIDFGLTPNRVVKLFSDTSYSKLDDSSINASLYAETSGPIEKRLFLEGVN